MAYFNRDSGNRSGRDNRGGGRGFGGGRSDGPREMFKTVCSSCGNECEVPFKPTNGKPVYCSACFEKMSPRTNDSGRSERPRNDRFERPERNRSDFGERPQAPRVDNSKQFEDLNKKLDKIIELLTPKVIEVAAVEEIKEVKVKSPKAKKAKIVKEDK